MFVPPFAIKEVSIHLVAFKIASSVAGFIDGDKKYDCPLKAIMLNVSCAFRWDRDASSALFVFSRGLPFMLALISTINTTSFPKTCQVIITECSIIKLQMDIETCLKINGSLIETKMRLRNADYNISILLYTDLFPDNFSKFHIFLLF